MPELGGAIGPKQSSLIAQTIEDALNKAVREQGDSVALVKASLEALTAVATRLSAIADQQQAATQSLADAARNLAARTVMPAPVVHVNVPEAPEPPEQEAPVVNVTVPEPVVTVTVQEPPEAEKGTRKRVVRDSQGLITEIIEEPLP